ncbi:MAG: MarR family transcriptional regulator [Pseudomonadota bacterium]
MSETQTTQNTTHDRALVFEVLNEIGILAQLSGAVMERHLPPGFQTSHFSVLNHLVRLGDERTPLRIARAFQVPKTTMTHTLAGLEKAGLIVFAPNPDDGRSKLVKITEAGRAFRDEAIAKLSPEADKVLAALGGEDLSELRPRLQRLREFLDAERDGKN